MSSGREMPGEERHVREGELILVDEHDQVLGARSKESCHDGEGVLHRAFSIFLLDGGGRVLLQQRSAEKRLWPLYWSNSCCSHPRWGETIEEAAQRRLQEELGVDAPLELLYRFTYHARFGAAGSEHELCAVLAGRSDAPVRANPAEIATCRLVLPEELDRALATEPERYTPWLQLEWRRLRADFNDYLRPARRG